MGLSDSDIKQVLHIVNSLGYLLAGTALDLDDLAQEAFAAFIVAKQTTKQNPLIYVEDKLRSIIQIEQDAVKTSLLEIVAPDPAERLVQDERSMTRRWLLSSLIDRCSRTQKIVLGLLYGLIDGICRTYREISNLFRVSIKQIEKIEREAIRAIRTAGGINLIRMKYR